MTQVQMVQRHITDHGSISSLDAFRDYGITRLSDVIFKLRRKCGWTIHTEMRESVNRYGAKVCYGVYRRIDAHPFAMIEKLS